MQITDQSIRLLLVDDSADQHTILQNWLEDLPGWRFDLDWVATADAAAAAIAAQQHDLYLIDYELGPGQPTGTELIRAAVDRGCIAPLIMLTATDDCQTDLAAMQFGAMDYLIKDEINGPLLERTIRHALERARGLTALRESEARYRQLVELSPLPIGVHQHECWVYVNPALAALLGTADPAELIGQQILAYVHPESQASARARIELLLQGGPPTALMEQRWIAQDGLVIDVEVTGQLIDYQGQPAIQVVLQDCTARKQAQAALRESEERYMLAVQGANDGLWDWQLQTQKIYFSARWKTLLGYGADELPNTVATWFSLVHPEDLAALQSELAAHVAGHTPHLECEYRMLGMDGGFRWVLCRGLAVRDAHGQAIRIAGSQTDISARKALETKLRHAAVHDWLTGLPNRTLLLDRLERAIAALQRRPEAGVAVLFLDLDGFKIINDSLGHAIGDQVLISMAQRLAACVRNADTVARLGGDEFVVVLTDIQDAADLAMVAERIQTQLRAPLQVHGHELVVGTSIGIAQCWDGAAQPEELLRDADTAMYQAKASGKGCYALFEGQMLVRARARLDLERELRRALEQDELAVYHQPIVDLEQGQIVGFEALVRWHHPERGVIAPYEFLPVAEETNLIIPIGVWVLKEACRHLRYWQCQNTAHARLTVNVNLSHKQFWHPELISQVQEALAASELEAASLRLEITEGVIMEQVDLALQIVQQLQRLDLHVHIDDFGIGASSLAALHRLPVEALKIDRAFISQMGIDAKSTEIVRTILLLGRHLGVRVIAEGVETPAQQQQLGALGCQYGQGYLFSRPVPHQAVPALLAQSKLGQI